MTEVDRVSDPVRPENREPEREAEETGRERGEPGGQLGRAVRVGDVQLQHEERHRDRINAVGECVEAIHVIATSPRS